MYVEEDLHFMDHDGMFCKWFPTFWRFILSLSWRTLNSGGIHFWM